jgi:hypothetical protein
MIGNDVAQVLWEVLATRSCMRLVYRVGYLETGSSSGIFIRCRNEFHAVFTAGLSRDQMKPLLGQRCKNLLHVLVPFSFEGKRDLHFAEVSL